MSVTNLIFIELGAVLLLGLVFRRRILHAWRVLQIARMNYTDGLSFTEGLEHIKKLGARGGNRDLIHQIVGQMLVSFTYIERYEKLTTTLESALGMGDSLTFARRRWDQEWANLYFGQDGARLFSVAEKVEMLKWGRPDSSWFTMAKRELLGRLENCSDDEILLLMNFWPADSSVYMRLATAAAQKMTGADAVSGLILRMRNDGHKPFGLVHLYVRLVELEPRSDVLTQIMGCQPVGSTSWNAAKAKLNAMPDPALETSSTYAAP